MLGNKRDRSYDERDPVGARSANLVVGRWADPLQRPDTALIADRPIEPRLVQSGDHRWSGANSALRQNTDFDAPKPLRVPSPAPRYSPSTASRRRAGDKSPAQSALGAAK